MAGAQNVLDIDINDAEIKAALKDLAAKLNDLTPFFKDAGETLLNSTRERFHTQTDPEGQPWKSLAPNYKQNKPRNKDKILTLYGYLRGTLVKQADSNSLRIGTPLVYGAIHQFGAAKGSFGTVTAHVNAYIRRLKSRDVKQGRKIVAKGVAFVSAHTRQMTVPWGNIPARPFLGLSTDDRSDLLEALHDYLAK
jgi:phage virion morphogenesis protein